MTFAWVPSYGAQQKAEPKVRGLRFGDGYEQRIVQGLTPTMRSWDLTFDARTDDEADAIEAYLEGKGGITSFSWLEPFGTSAEALSETSFGTGDGSTTIFTITTTAGELTQFDTLTGADLDTIQPNPWDLARAPYTSRRTNFVMITEPTTSSYSIMLYGTVTDTTAPSPFTGQAALNMPAGSGSSIAIPVKDVGLVNPILSVFVKMADGSAPTIGASSSSGDFCLGHGDKMAENLTVTAVGGGVYRCSAKRSWTSNTTSISVSRAASQATKAMTVWGWQLEESGGLTAPTAYIQNDSRGKRVAEADYINDPTILIDDWQGKRVLYDTARTNYCKQSQTMGSWKANHYGTAVDPVVTADAGTAPDGTTTADRIQFDCGPTGSYLDYSRLTMSLTGLTASADYVLSFWIKSYSGSTELVLLHLPGTGWIPYYATTSWVRHSIVFNLGATTSLDIPFQTNNDSGSTRYADVMIWGVQLEKDVVPGSYIPTTTAAASRTDYAITGGTVTFAVAPVSAADLLWIGSGDVVRKWICKSWNRRYTGSGTNTITASFQQVMV